MSDEYKELILFLLENGFTISMEENHGIVASIGETTLLVSPTPGKYFAARAIDMAAKELTSLYHKDVDRTTHVIAHQIGYWAFYNKKLPTSSRLFINNNDHSVQEIMCAIEIMKKNQP